MSDDKITTDIFDKPEKPKPTSKPISLDERRAHKKEQEGLAKLFDNVNRWTIEGKMIAVMHRKDGHRIVLNLDSVLKHCDDLNFCPGDGQGNYTHYYYLPGFNYNEESKK